MTSLSAVPKKRIRALLALAQSPNPHEALRAREQADELLSKYGVSEGDVSEQVAEKVNIPEGKSGHQREELARVVAQSRSVVMKPGRSSQILFVGYAEAAKDARQLYVALVKLVEARCEYQVPGQPMEDPYTAAMNQMFGTMGVSDLRFEGVTITAEMARHIHPQSHLARQPDNRESNQYLWRSCYWLGFIEGIQKKLNPERGTIPRAALQSLARDVTPDDFLKKAAEAFNSLAAMSGQYVAEDFKRSAHEAGKVLADATPLTPYHRKINP